MNVENIFERINEEKQVFLEEFENEDVFMKSSKNPLETMSCSEDQSNFSMLIIIFNMMIIIGVFIISKNLLPFSYSINILLSFLTGPVISVLLLRKGIFTFFKHKYKNRNKNNAVKRYFEHQFYKKEISIEIHNMLKIYLSDKEYIDLRRKNDKITYKIVEPYITEIQTNEHILSEKKEVFLTPEEITKYSYSKS